MRAESPKRIKTNREYAALRKQFMLRNPRCQVLIGPGRRCPNPATDLHHRKGRRQWLLAEETFLAVCHECHGRIHGKLAAWAHRMGYLINIASTQPIAPPSPIFLDYDSA